MNATLVMTLVIILILSWWDCCKSLLTGSPASLPVPKHPLRVIFLEYRFNNVTPLLKTTDATLNLQDDVPAHQHSRQTDAHLAGSNLPAWGVPSHTTSSLPQNDLTTCFSTRQAISLQRPFFCLFSTSSFPKHTSRPSERGPISLEVIKTFPGKTSSIIPPLEH